MADQKISELTEVTSIAATDILNVVSSGANKRITAANLFSNVPTPASFSGKVSITGSDTLTGGGAVSVATNITYLSNPSGAGVLSIGAGVEGQVKIILMIANTAGHALTLDGATLAHDTVTFDALGDTATLIYTNTKWYMIGGSATIA
jgi:hypothetical protein